MEGAWAIVWIVKVGPPAKAVEKHAWEYAPGTRTFSFINAEAPLRIGVNAVVIDAIRGAKYKKKLGLISSSRRAVRAIQGIGFLIKEPRLHLLVDKDRAYELGFVPRFSNRLQIRSKDKKRTPEGAEATGS